MLLLQYAYIYIKSSHTIIAKNMLTKILKRFGAKKVFALVLLIFKLKKHSIFTWHIFSPWHRPSERHLKRALKSEA